MTKKNEVKIKWVKRANMWCKTTVTYDEKEIKHFAREWFAEKPV